MITRDQILELMPPADGKNRVDYAGLINSNIIKTIHSNMPRATEITKPVAHLFKGDSVESTCRNIWQFLRKEVKYVKDQENQDIKLPNRFIMDGTGDCKSYSLFAGSILKNLGIPEAFRYTSYSADPTPQHVYVVALTGKKKINGLSEVVITDGVWHRFNKQKPYTFKKDFMPIRTLSGTEDPQIGNIFKKAGQKLKDAGSKVQDKLKDTKVVKEAAKAQDKLKDTAVVKAGAKAQDAIKTGAIKVVKAGTEALKDVPDKLKMVAGAPARRAFRTLVALNFHSYANKLAAHSSTRATWEKLGGSWRELDASIQAGLKRKAILGIGCMDCRVVYKPAGIGDPATIAAALAAAAPIILAFSGILKEAFSAIKAGRDALRKNKPESPAPGNSGSGAGSGGANNTSPTSPAPPEGGGAVNPAPPTEQLDLENSPADGSGYRDPQASNGGRDNYRYPGYDPNAYYPGYDSEASGSGARDAKQPVEEKKDNTGLLVAGAVLAKLLLF